MLEIHRLGGQTFKYIDQCSNQNDCYFQSMYTPTYHIINKGINTRLNFSSDGTKKSLFFCWGDFFQRVSFLYAIHFNSINYFQMTVLTCLKYL